MLVAHIAAQREQAGTYGSDARPTLTPGKIHSPAFTGRRELDPRRWKGCIGDGFLPSFVTFALDPIAMALKKMLNGARRGSRRHDDLDAPSVEHSHGQASGTRTLSNDPRLGGILVRP